MNRVDLSGRITAVPELKQTSNGKSVCDFSLAVERPKVKEQTDFFTVIAWNSIAEYLCRYVKKGDNVEVCGILTTRQFEDRSGNKRTVYEIQADYARIVFGRKNEDDKTSGNGFIPFIPHQEKAEQTSFEEIQNDDDLPF